MSREHAYAYEAGYRDGSINYELERCPACKNIADLQEALSENAKLRELVHAMTYCMTGRCLQCPMCAPFDTSIGGAPECRASWKLHELGIEVGE